jgi:hypothetical protein
MHFKAACGVTPSAFKILGGWSSKVHPQFDLETYSTASAACDCLERILLLEFDMYTLFPE